MAHKIQVKRGNKADLPTLDAGEFGLCQDTNELFIGNNGNKKIFPAETPTISDVVGLQSALDGKVDKVSGKLSASEISIEDVGNFYESDNIEDALGEIGEQLLESGGDGSDGGIVATVNSTRPTTTDDSSKGHKRGDIWIYERHYESGTYELESFQCLDDSESLAKWAMCASVTADPDDTSNAPGSKFLLAGTMEEGFFGEVSASELITGNALASAVGISEGTSQFSNEPWLKFAWQGKILFVAKKPIRHSISWDHINSASAVYGSKSVAIDGLSYKIRLLKGAITDPSEYQNTDRGARGSEWNRLMLPIHQEAIDKSWAYPAYVESNIPVWAHSLGTGVQGRYTDEDLLAHYAHGSGAYSWCQETRKDNTANRVRRCYGGVSDSSSYASYLTHSNTGWRPCLEFSV